MDDTETTTHLWSVVALIAWLVGLVLVLAALVAFGSALPTPPDGVAAIPRWVDLHGTTTAVLTVVRIGALAVAAYLLATTSLAVLAEFVGGVRTVRFSRSLLTSTQRRVVSAVVGVGLTVVSTTPPAMATAPDDAAVMVVVDEGTTSDATIAPPVEIMHVVTTSTTSAPGSSTTTGLPPTSVLTTSTTADAPPPDGATTSSKPGGDTPTTSASPSTSRPGPDALPDQADARSDEPPPPSDPSPTTPDAATSPTRHTWKIEPGDHLWRVAHETLADGGSPATDAQTADYLERIVDANSEVFVVASSPDLVYAGQVFVLPEVVPVPTG